MHPTILMITALVAASASGAQAECLSRPITYDAGDAIDSDAAKVAMIEVPADEIQAYADAGYVRTSCTAAWGVKKIDGCALAGFGNEAVQARFTTLFGIVPARICASQRKLDGKEAASPPQAQ